MSRQEIKEEFGEDMEVIPKEKFKTAYYIEHEKKFKPITENTTNNTGASEKIMEIVIGHGNGVRKNLLQCAIAVKGSWYWCTEKNVAPSCTELVNFLNITRYTY